MMEILIDLEKDDWKKFQLFIEKELPKSVKTWTDSFIALWAVVGGLFAFLFDKFSEFHWPTAVAISTFFILFLMFLIIRSRKLNKAFSPSDVGVFVGQHQFFFNEKGIKSNGKGYESFHAWTIVKKIERTKGMILIYLDTAYAFVFPEGKLENPDEFFSYIVEQYKNAVDTTG